MICQQALYNRQVFSTGDSLGGKRLDFFEESAGSAVPALMSSPGCGISVRLHTSASRIHAADTRCHAERPESRLENLYRRTEAEYVNHSDGTLRRPIYGQYLNM